MKIMRWALRNQEKIKAHFEPYGDEILERIKESLNQAFTSKDVEKHIDKIENEPYPILYVTMSAIRLVAYCSMSSR